MRVFSVVGAMKISLVRKNGQTSWANVSETDNASDSDAGSSQSQTSSDSRPKNMSRTQTFSPITKQVCDIAQSTKKGDLGSKQAVLQHDQRLRV